MNCCDLAYAQLAALAASFGVRIVTPVEPDAEPITLEEAWSHLRIDTFGSPLESADDPWLVDIGIPAARAWAEHYTALTIAVRTMEWSARGFPATIELPFGPLREVESIIYVDADGLDQTLDPAEYTVNPYATPATVKPVTSWPTAKEQDRSIRVTYVAGYSEDSPATPMPAEIKIGVLLMLGHLFENREDTTTATLSMIPNGARTFLDTQRERFGFA